MRQHSSFGKHNIISFVYFLFLVVALMHSNIEKNAMTGTLPTEIGHMKGLESIRLGKM